MGETPLSIKLPYLICYFRFVFISCVAFGALSWGVGERRQEYVFVTPTVLIRV